MEIILIQTFVMFPSYFTLTFLCHVFVYIYVYNYYVYATTGISEDEATSLLEEGTKKSKPSRKNGEFTLNYVNLTSYDLFKNFMM